MFGFPLGHDQGKALAALAGNTVVTAAVTDAWEAARKGFARLLGRGDPDKMKLAERRLAETHDQLSQVTGADLEQTRVALEAQWVTRMADLLEEDPGIEADLRALVQEIRAQLPARVMTAADHSVVVGDNANISATRGGVSAYDLTCRSAYCLTCRLAGGLAG